MNLFDICKKENLTYEELKEGIDKFSSEINKVNRYQEIALTLLCKHNPEIKLIELMVQSGANVKISDINLYLPYLFLSEKDFDLDVVECIIKLGCDIGYKSGYFGDTILNKIIANGVFSIKKLEMLLKFKPDMINEVNEYKIGPLMFLCKCYPELELVKLFVKYGADPKLSDLFRSNCLMYLFLSKNDPDVNLIEYLISQGCDIGTKNSYYNTNILHEIIFKKVFTTKRLEILMKLKPDMINEIDKSERTPLMYLCKYCPELELVKLFVKYGAKVDVVDYENKNCLFYLFNSDRNFDLNIAKYLISQGCKFTGSINGNLLSLFVFGINFEKIDFLAGYNQKLDNTNSVIKQYFNFKNKLSFCSNQLFY